MTQSTPEFGWGHININVSDLEASIGFYKKLGFSVFLPEIPYLGIAREAENYPMSAALLQAYNLNQGEIIRGCIMSLDKGYPKLDLIEYADPQAQQPAGGNNLGMARICLASKGVVADYETLSKQDVEFLSPPALAQNDMATVAVCKDPDGTLIELIELHMKNWRNRAP